MNRKMERFVYRSIVVLFIMLPVSPSAIDAQKKDTYELPDLSPALRNELFEFIVAAHQTAEEYVIGKFSDHDIIFIGEFHRIKQHVVLIQNLIPELYENGVYNLGIEYALYEDQPLMDSLLTSPTYDESIAYTLLFNQYPFWGYQEYADLFRAAWMLNKNLQEGNRPFHIVGLNVKADWSHVTSSTDRDNPEVLKAVWEKGSPDEFMAATIIAEFVEKNEKALIFSGTHHAFSEYKQPCMDPVTLEFLGSMENRMGNLIYERIGKRAITIMLHAPWINAKGYEHPYVYPADGIIDALLALLPRYYRNVGFDVKGTPFGSLPAKTSLYKFGCDNFTFADLCDGYICQCALSAYSGVTPIKNFITDETLEEAKRQSPNPAFKADSITADDFNTAIRRDSDISHWLQKYE
jgi:hypothetical protein